MIRAYGSLTPQGKIRRLRAIAVAALEEFDLRFPAGDAGAALRFHRFETNLFFRVMAVGYPRGLILRLATPGWRTTEDLENEALWLEALSGESGITVLQIIAARDGRRVIQGRAEHVPDVWNVTLFTYVPGRLLGTTLTPANLRKMGELFARLHLHAGGWALPSGFHRRVFDRWLSRGERNAIMAPDALAAYPRGLADILSDIADEVNAGYAALDPSDLRVIHCDLWHDNIKVHRGELIPFDFEDTILGYRIHDIAMAMLDLLEDTDDISYRALLAEFRHGYEQFLAWPDGSLELFQAGRILWQLNWVASNQPEHLPRAARRLGGVLRAYRETGRISLAAQPFA
jgi:Ser/Thr protein kinase RdoA (MazF antagonist)